MATRELPLRSSELALGAELNRVNLTRQNSTLIIFTNTRGYFSLFVVKLTP